MIYELGDKVRIIKYWKRNPMPYNWEEHLKENAEDLAGRGIDFDKFVKTTCDEIGYICGRRSLKISTTLSYEFDDGIDFGGVGYQLPWEGIRQLDSKHVIVYLVATRMNCLRKVDFEDIEFLKER